jgi:predicted esterase
MKPRMLLVACLLSLPSLAAAPKEGYQAKVAVTAPTRLDWTFALTNRSLDPIPAEFLPDYDSAKQTFELYVPARPNPKKLLPVIVFISPGNDPAGWKNFEKPCKDLGFVFIGVRDAGNDVPGKKRVRIVLDALDEVRRTLPTDPDRTYIAGFSGGGRIACAIGFALPENFGGVVPICAAGELRSESWLRQRCIDRLSVALLSGSTDFNRGEVERWRGPQLKEVGVRTKVWVQDGLGHGIPNAKTLTEALRWLDEGAEKRAEFAKKYPASRVAGDTAPSRKDAAAALLAEGEERLKQRETLYSGLMLAQGCMTRWSDTPSAEAAKALLEKYEAMKDKPWEADDLAEQRKFLVAEARSLDAYASGDLPTQYVKLRPDMAKKAVQLWKQVLADNPDSDAGREAKKRIPELEKLADK